MHHKAHIGLVYAHSEGVCRNNQIAPVVDKILLISVSLFCTQTCVVNERAMPVFVEKVAHLFNILACGAVNNSAFTFMLIYNRKQLPALAVRLLDRKKQIFSVKACCYFKRINKSEKL